MDNSSSLSIETHVFSKGLRNQHIKALVKEISYRPDIFLEATASKSLVSRIKEGDEVVRLHYFTDFFPLLYSGVHSSWVVSTRVKNDH